MNIADIADKMVSLAEKSGATQAEVYSVRVKITNTNNVSDALTTVPGTYLNVGTKNERNIIVRGLSQKYAPVFFDGIPIYLPYDGFVDTGNLSTNNISKILPISTHF